MINVDGVYNGHYRLSVFNENLNRWYTIPDVRRHPEVFGIKRLL